MELMMNTGTPVHSRQEGWVRKVQIEVQRVDTLHRRENLKEILKILPFKLLIFVFVQECLRHFHGQMLTNGDESMAWQSTPAHIQFCKRCTLRKSCRKDFRVGFIIKESWIVVKEEHIYRLVLL